MRELDSLNVSTLIERTHVFPRSDSVRKSFALRLAPKICDSDPLPYSAKALSLLYPSPLHNSRTRSSHPLSLSETVDSSTMIEVPSPTKFITHSHCSTELDPLDFKNDDDSGSASSDEDVFLPDSVDPIFSDKPSVLSNSRTHPTRCSPWKWHQVPLSHLVRSSAHRSTNSADRVPGNQSTLCEEANPLDGNSDPSNLIRSRVVCEPATTSQEDSTPSLSRSSSERDEGVSNKVPVVRVPINSDSILSSSFLSDPPSGDADTHACRAEPQSSDAKANMCTAYSLHAERLKLLSAFCALRSPGFSHQTMEKLRPSQSHHDNSSFTSRVMGAPWSIQRCEFKWLLCILISAPIDSMHNLSQLLQRISPSLELTTKLRLPWHSASHRKAQANNNRSQYDVDSERSGFTRSHRNSDHEDVCGSIASNRSHVMRHRNPRAAAKIPGFAGSLDDTSRHHLTVAKHKALSCDEEKDRKTYAAVAAAAAAVPPGPRTSSTPCSSWLTPAEASRSDDVSPKLYQPVHEKQTHREDGTDGCASSNLCSGNSSTERSSIQIEDSSLPSNSMGGICATSPKVSVVSARMVKDSLSASRSNLSSRSPPWMATPTSCSRRNYMTRTLPIHSRQTNALLYRSQIQPNTCDLSCPAYALPYQNSYAYSTACEYVPRKTRSCDECCTSFNYPDNLHLGAVAQEPTQSPTDSVTGVFVDLTGYDVTVSVERLPPITDVPSHPRGPRSRFEPNDIRSQSLTAPPYSVCDPYRLSNEHRYPLPMTLPISPPPPYSECVYTGPLSSASSPAFLSNPYDVSWHYPVHPPTTTTTPTTRLLQSRRKISSTPPPHLSSCQPEPRSWMVPNCSTPAPSFSSTNMCSCQPSFASFQNPTSPPFAPVGFCSCGASIHSLGPSCSPVHRDLYGPALDYSGFHEQSCPGEYPDHQLSFASADYRQRPNFQRQISCPEHPFTLSCRNSCDRMNTTKPLSIQYAPELNTLPFLSNPHEHSSPAGGWVYVPEPIRVSRSQDVYNALRTCLVPHYELRDYATSAPPPRQWRRLEEPNKDGFAFTLMCYNLLCPSYATQNMYPYCPSWALNWDYRRRAILDEIRVYHANIICLQEVETNQFEEIFKPELEKLKYDAVFLPKSRCRTMDMKDCKKVDGCAIFWQVDKFEKLHEFHHEFMFSCSNMCENPSPLIVNRVMTRDNVALGVIFETKGAPGPDGPGGRQFCVTTGHIHWDPELSDVKMIQTILWTAELWAYIDQFLTGSGDLKDRGSPTNTRNTPLSNRVPVPGPSSPAVNMPVILCGDLNSLPDSGVVEFLMRGSLPKSHTDFLNNGFKYMFEDWRLLEKWAVDGDTLRHRFTFDRAYRESQGMQLTNFTYEFKGMIDYVLFSRQHFRLLGSLDQIHESWFAEKKIVGCPHVHIPSDHFALLVELELKPTPQLASIVAARSSARSRCRSEGGSSLENGHPKTGPRGGGGGGGGGGGSSLGCSPHSTGGITPDGIGRQDANSDTAATGSSNTTGKHRKR